MKANLNAQLEYLELLIPNLAEMAAAEEGDNLRIAVEALQVAQLHVEKELAEAA